MSSELQLETQDYVTKALKNAQEATSHKRAWCHRKPKHWALTAQHIIQQPSEVTTFLKKNKITRNFYYDTKTELLSDPECEAIRNAWGSEVASVMFQGLDTHRQLQEKFSEEVEKEGFVVDQDVLFKHGKQLQAFNDIHSKLTGNNIQRHVVEHVVSQAEYENKADELKAKIAKAKIEKAKEAEVIEID